ncbi:tail fiber assembly protein [Pseudomonas helvetica]|uniref:tail fiber assembly protein n=1 Tax=Pseudomonas helvetica TaxID=3136738 RepID=UPI0032643A8E
MVSTDHNVYEGCRAAFQHLASVIAITEAAHRRSVADCTITPLQDAVDIDEATDTDVALLKSWKKYRVALNRIETQTGYPETIDWPVAPA